MCVMIYLNKDVVNDEFTVAKTLASADYVGIMHSHDDALKILNINNLLTRMDSSVEINNVEKLLDSDRSIHTDKSHTLDYLKSMGIDSIISSSYTSSSLSLFRRYGFKTYKAINTQLEDNLACFFNSELKPYTYGDTISQGCMSLH